MGREEERKPVGVPLVLTLQLCLILPADTVSKTKTLQAGISVIPLTTEIAATTANSVHSILKLVF